MREIKFRGWDGTRMWYDVQNAYDWIDGEESNNGDEIPATNFARVLKEMKVMQFTGLHDKNGKEIYEGDVLRMDQWEPENVQVKFLEGAFCLCFLSGEFKEQFAGDIHYIQHAERPRSTVIGNIYENPELLTTDV